MPKKRFKRRVAVYRGFARYYIAAAAAEHLLAAGLAKVRQKNAKVIAEIELTPLANGWQQGQVAPDKLGLHPGSFGIRIEAWFSGVFCYAHGNRWDEVIPLLS